MNPKQQKMHTTAVHELSNELTRVVIEIQGRIDALEKVVTDLAAATTGRFKASDAELHSCVTLLLDAMKDEARTRLGVDCDIQKVVGNIERDRMADYQHFEAVCSPLCNSTLWTRLRWIVTGT